MKKDTRASADAVYLKHDAALTRRGAIMAGVALTAPALLKGCKQGAAESDANSTTAHARSHSKTAVNRAATSGAAAAAKPLANVIADYIYDARPEDFDRDVIEKAKEQLIYHVGLAFSGALTDEGRQAVEIARVLSGAPGNATIIGHGIKAAALEASFANSMFMRALGRDDVLFPSATHAGLLTYPVAFAVGEQVHCSGIEMLAAVVIGYEVLGKMTTEIALDRLRRPSMPFGPFASTAVAAKLMGLTREQTASAIGYAADSAMGLKAGHEQQPTHIYGLIARNAIMSAIVANAGGETSPTILEEEYGFYATVVGRPAPRHEIASRLGNDPEILRATQKRYPGTAMNIVPIELIRSILSENNLGMDSVGHVYIDLPEDRKSFTTSISPGPYPTRTQAESSVVFQTAIILLDGDNNSTRYDRANDPEIRAAIDKISVNLIRHQNDRYARLTVHAKDGRAITKEGLHHDFPALDGGSWLRQDGDKFLPGSNLDQFAAFVHNIEDIEDVRTMTSLLVGQTQ